MTTLAPPTTQPSWCTNGAACRGDHMGSAVSIPATGGNGVRVFPGGARYPAILAAPAHEVTEGAAPTVRLQVVGGQWEVVASLRADEARRLVNALEAALAAISGG